MIDWYVTHIYVMPWWAYVLPLYPLIGAATFRVIQIITLDEHDPDLGIAPLIVTWWPIVILSVSVYAVFRISGWILGFTDESYSRMIHSDYTKHNSRE